MPHMQDVPEPRSTFRVDVKLHQILVSKDNKQKSLLPSTSEPEMLPEAVFPSRPQLVNYPDPETVPDKRTWGAPDVYRTMRGWLFPYVRSRVLPGEFHPIIASSPSGSATLVAITAGRSTTARKV